MRWTCREGRFSCPHLENVGLSLAVVACEGGVDWPADAPHILHELWITRKNCLVVQFKKIFPLKMKTNDGSGPQHTSEMPPPDSPLNANMEPFFTCIKESKGLPLHATASGSGASVVPVVSGSVRGGSVTFSTGALCCTGPGGLVISRATPDCWCVLRSKLAAGGSVGLTRRLLAGGEEGVVASDSSPSSSSSATTNVSPRAGGKGDVGEHGRTLGTLNRTERCVNRGSYSTGHTQACSQSSSFCSIYTWSHTGTSSESRSHSHSGPNRTLGTTDFLHWTFRVLVYSITG